MISFFFCACVSLSIQLGCSREVFSMDQGVINLILMKLCFRIASSITHNEQRRGFLILSGKILPVVRRQHLLLCTLLIGNALAMEVRFSDWLGSLLKMI